MPTRNQRKPNPKKKRSEHLRPRGTVRRLAANHALQLRRLGTPEAGAVIGHRAPKRGRLRSRKTRGRTLTGTLLHRSVGIQMTRTALQMLTGAAISPAHVLDGLRMRPRLREKREIPSVIVAGAETATLGGQEAAQSGAADRGVGLSEEMIGGELAALHALAATTTHLTGGRDRPAGEVLIEQTDATHRDQ